MTACNLRLLELQAGLKLPQHAQKTGTASSSCEFRLYLQEEQTTNKQSMEQQHCESMRAVQVAQDKLVRERNEQAQVGKRLLCSAGGQCLFGTWLAQHG